MFKNHVRSSFRYLWKNRVFSLVNIFGFAFGIAVCLAIAAFLIHEYTVDRYHPYADHIFRLVNEENNSSSIDYRVKQMLTTNFPEVQNACLFQLLPYQTQVNVDRHGYYVNSILSTDNAFFKMFTVPFVRGDAENPLKDLHSVVLTESTARKLFGNEDPLGKEILIRKTYPVTVTGIIRDFPDRSSIHADLIVNAENDEFKFSIYMGNGADKSTYRWPFRIYLLLNREANPGEFTAKLNSHPDMFAPYIQNMGLLPLTDMYLHDTTSGSATNRGNPGLLRLMLIIGLLILTLAVINYINLTVAQQNNRRKEIGVKKIVGAGHKNLILQFTTESLIIITLAFCLAIVILEFARPVMQSIFFRTFDYSQLLQFPYSVFLVLSFLLLGAIAGGGTALIFSSVKPLQAITGRTIFLGKKHHLRNILTVFQFSVSIILIFCIIVVQKQIHFVKHTNPGFNEEHLLRVDLPRFAPEDRNSALLLVDKWRQYPGVKHLSLTNGIPGYINTTMGANMAGKDKFVSVIYADTSFLKTFGMEVVNGRTLQPGDYGHTCMVNEAAYKYFGWDNLENKRFNNGREGGFEVIGVVKDFHYSSFHNQIEPLCILFQFGTPTNISVRLASGNIGVTMDNLVRTWKEVLPEYPITYQFYDQWFDAIYQQEERFARAIGIFAVLAVIISCIGILGMAIFTAEQRTKEIGIRKVVGASVPNILVMLMKNITQWILLANLIAWPIAWYAMHQWLQNFAYRTSIGWWVFALAGILALVIALLTVSGQALRAATANPVESLRYE